MPGSRVAEHITTVGPPEPSPSSVAASGESSSTGRSHAVARSVGPMSIRVRFRANRPRRPSEIHRTWPGCRSSRRAWRSSLTPSQLRMARSKRCAAALIGAFPAALWTSRRLVTARSTARSARVSASAITSRSSPVSRPDPRSLDTSPKTCSRASSTASAAAPIAMAMVGASATQRSWTWASRRIRQPVIDTPSAPTMASSNSCASSMTRWSWAGRSWPPAWTSAA